MRRLFSSLALVALLAGVPALGKGKPKPRDGGVALTPADQGENLEDVKITQAIRQAVEADKRLAFSAKEVQIIARGGEVTLSGDVRSNLERTLVREHATAIAGDRHVDDRMTVRGGAPPSSF